MARVSDSYTIKYEGYYDIADEAERIGATYEGYLDKIAEAFAAVRGYHAVYHQMGDSVVQNLTDAGFACDRIEQRLTNYIPRALRAVAATVEEHEKAARGRCHWWGRNGAVQSDTFDHNGMADDFYAAAAAAKAQADADAEAAAAAEQKRQQDEADRLAKEAEMVAIMGAISQTAAQEYNDRIIEAQFQALMEYYKDDPVMLEKIRKDYEAWKKSREEAAKLAEQGIDPDAFLGEGGLGEGGGLGDLASDLGMDLGGGGGGGFGGGGLGDLGGDWAGSDWASDLLDEGLETDDFLGADGALDDILGSSVSDPVCLGEDAAADAADLGEGAGVLGAFGSQLASVVQSYGLQAALAIGGGVALYATSEQTIEAAAHVAEFVSTKCKPAVNDVMEQVRGMAKQTRVNLGNAKSNVKAAARGEKAGDLVG